MGGPRFILRTQLGGYHPPPDSVRGKGDPPGSLGSFSLSPKPPHGLIIEPSGQFHPLRRHPSRTLLSPPRGEVNSERKQAAMGWGPPCAQKSPWPGRTEQQRPAQRGCAAFSGTTPSAP